MNHSNSYADVKRAKCPDCPDGQLWDNKGPTDDACPTCGGEAFIWVEVQPDATHVPEKS
jgi:uncharacterized protein (DUF983 family)